MAGLPRALNTYLRHYFRTQRGFGSHGRVKPFVAAIGKSLRHGKECAPCGVRNRPPWPFFSAFPERFSARRGPPRTQMCVLKLFLGKAGAFLCISAAPGEKLMIGLPKKKYDLILKCSVCADQTTMMWGRVPISWFKLVER